MNPESLLLPVISIARVIIPYVLLAITFYVCVSKPLKKQYQQDCWIKNQLKPDCFITTSDGVSGKVIRVLHHTVIIERPDSLKVEIVKLSIIDVSNILLEQATTANVIPDLIGDPGKTNLLNPK